MCVCVGQFNPFCFTFGGFFQNKDVGFFSALEFYPVYSLTISYMHVEYIFLHKFEYIHNFECIYVYIYL